MKEQGRGKKVAIIGSVVQLAVVIVAVLIWQQTRSQAVLNSLWFLLGGVFMWIISAVMFYAAQLANQEELELREIAQAGQADTIFDEEKSAEFMPNARRLKFMQKWLTPILVVLLSGYNAALAIWVLTNTTNAEIKSQSSTLPAAVFLLICGFALFLFSRYATGMGTQRQWRLLRANGSYALACVIVFAMLFASLLFYKQSPVLEYAVAWIVPAIQLAFAAECVLNLILDIYRPRRPGDEYRVAYDSRIFDLIAEPGRVGHSIADTLNYQFGFEVSKTWFYQLISKAFVSLVIFGVLVMFALTCIVIVRPGEQYVVKTWGRLPAGNKTLKPGLNFKLPWPIATAQRFETGKIQEMVLGVGGEVPMAKTIDNHEMLLWSEAHGFSQKEEQDFLIAVPPRDVETSAPSVSIIKLVVLLQYQINDVYKYGYSYANSPEAIKAIAEQEMVEYCAAATLDKKMKGGDAERPQAIMTSGREAAAANLKKRIQQRFNKANLGVDIVFLGISSAHPPADAVESFEKVLEAERLQDKQRYGAQAQASEILASVSGNPDVAMQLYVDLWQAEIFEKLQREVNSPEQFKDSISEFLYQTSQQIDSLDKAIHREKLLGKTNPQMDALRKSYVEVQQQLTKADKEVDKYDYTSQIIAARKAANSKFNKLDGEPAKLLADASAYRWQRDFQEQTALEAYRRMLKPFQMAPRVYMFDRYMDVLDVTLPNMQKYVMGIDPDKIQLRLNLEQAGSDILGQALQSAGSK